MPRRVAILVAFAGLVCPALLPAQDAETPLGDLARTLRAEKQGPDQPVIDNDNIAVMMDKAESERLNGKPVFSIDPSGKNFTMTSPDGSCSLSFDAKARALITTPFVSSNLPEDALSRLDGSAMIHGNAIEISLKNATDWELKEIVVGLTIVNSQGPMILKSANLLLPSGEMTTKSPDTTMLYHLKATASPGGSGVFHGTLDVDIPPGTNWHWALVGARGIPPAPPPVTLPAPASALTLPLPPPSVSVPPSAAGEKPSVQVPQR